MKTSIINGSEVSRLSVAIQTEVGSKVTPPFKVGTTNLNGFNGNGGSTTARSLIIDLSTASDVYTTGLTEARMNSLTGCFVIRYSGRAQNAGSLDAMTLSARMESINADLLAKSVATNARIDYAVISPSGNYPIGTRTLYPNPFGNDVPVFCEVEFYHATLLKWVSSAFIWVGSSAGYGMRAAFVAGEGISLVSAPTGFATMSVDSASSIALPAHYSTPSPVRIHVRKVTKNG